MAKKPIKKKNAGKIEITCKGAAVVPYTKLLPTQGDLKELRPADYEDFKFQILELGFSEPITVWKHEGKYRILNGHQRALTVKKMVEEEDYECPPLPISFCDAKDFNEAKRKILSMTSQFGHVTDEGLTEFLKDSDISPEEIRQFRLVDVNTEKFINQFNAQLPDENAEAETPGNPVLSQVRTVQLFFDEASADKFQEMIEALKTKYKTTALTETILMAVEAADARHHGIHGWT